VKVLGRCKKKLVVEKQQVVVLGEEIVQRLVIGANSD